MQKVKVYLVGSLVCTVIFILGKFLTETELDAETSENVVANGTDLAENQILFQDIPECSCKRLLLYPPPYNVHPVQIYNTSCSDQGTFYQAGQRVITFTMFYSPTDKKRQALYREGISTNLQRMREYHPGHSMRLYTDIKPDSQYCNVICNNSDLFWCDIKNTPSLGDMSEMYPRNWRFLTLGDPTVEYFLSRDLDSAIIEREVGVVHDWLQIGKPIHVMRDKWRNHDTPILAGMWGARNNLLRDRLKLRDEIIRRAESDKRYKQQDQAILRDVIYYPKKNDIVAYDSYHCKYYGKTTMTRPFPTRRKNNGSDFVGNYDLGRKPYKLDVCPVECRPSYGKDWKYC